MYSGVGTTVQQVGRVFVPGIGKHADGHLMIRVEQLETTTKILCQTVRLLVGYPPAHVTHIDIRKHVPVPVNQWSKCTNKRKQNHMLNGPINQSNHTSPSIKKCTGNQLLTFLFRSTTKTDRALAKQHIMHIVESHTGWVISDLWPPHVTHTVGV